MNNNTKRKYFHETRIKKKEKRQIGNPPMDWVLQNFFIKICI